MNAVTALIGHPGWLGWVALKAFLLYVTAVIGLRAGGRRTLAELSPYDFVAAVAVGAIVGRLPSAPDASYLSGAVTLLAILAAHALITWVRLQPKGRWLIEKGPVVVVSRGRVLSGKPAPLRDDPGRPRRPATGTRRGRCRRGGPGRVGGPGAPVGAAP